MRYTWVIAIALGFMLDEVLGFFMTLVGTKYNDISATQPEKSVIIQAILILPIVIGGVLMVILASRVSFAWILPLAAGFILNEVIGALFGWIGTRFQDPNISPTSQGLQVQGVFVVLFLAGAGLVRLFSGNFSREAAN